MTTEILSLAKYLASSRAEFALSEMNLYLGEKHGEKELYELLKPHFYELDLFCGSDFRCKKMVKQALPVDESIIRELEQTFTTPKLPKSIEKLVESYVEKSCGKDWYRGETAELIRGNIVKQKEEYWKGRAQYPGIRIISYLLYHFPVYFCQFQYILLDLFKSGLLSNRMSFLDVGAGPGTITLSTLDFLRRLLEVYSKKNLDVRMNIRINAIEQAKENVDCYNELASHYLSGLEPENANIIISPPVHAPMEKAQAPEADFIIFSNVLAELRYPPGQQASVVERIASASRNPTLILIEPAELITSKALRVTQHALVTGGFTIYSPCTFIWGIGCTGENCWSFQELGNIRVPGFMEKIAGAEEPYRYINTDMKFSSVILRKDGLRKHVYEAKGKFTRLANLKKHMEKRVNIAASVMSRNLGDERTFVFRLCDGTTSIPCYAVLPAYHKSENNRNLLAVAYGDVVEVYSTLVRENREQKSYNLLITRSTRIKKAG